MQLNLYLLKPGASPADAVPNLAEIQANLLRSAHPANGSASAAQGAGHDDEGWLRTWLISREEITEGALPTSRDVAALLVRATPASSPWLALLSTLAPGVPLTDGQMHHGGLVFQPIGRDIALWSFGNAWTLIDPTTTVDRFGLRVGLNALLSVKPPSVGRAPNVGVRELTSAIRAAVVRKSTVVTARPSSPRAIERLDQTSDAATMAQLTTHHRTFGRVAAGRSLRFEAAVSSMHDLARLGAQAVRLHRRNDYQRHDDYKWIDYTIPVSDPEEINALLDAVWDSAVAPSPLHFDLVWADADTETGLVPRTVRFPLERDKGRTELPWPAALAYLRTSQEPDVAGRVALRTRLRFFESSDAGPVVETELWKLLVAQIAVEGRTYLVSDGEVWQTSAAYIADMDASLETHVVVNPATLPRYRGGEREDSYNRRAAAFGGHFLLDKKLVQVPGQTAVEAADLLSADGELMHVKRKTGSATMSHVTAQALASAQLLRSSPQARALLDELLISAVPAPTHLQAMRDHCASFGDRPSASVHIVIAGTWSGVPSVSQLPLLTRINLNGWVRQMPCERRLVLVGT